MDREVCVHCFLDDKNICQYLPWTKRAWLCGRAFPNGPSGNGTHISIEICELPNIKYDLNKTTAIISYDQKNKENQEHFKNIY